VLTINCVKTIRTHTKFVQDVQFGPSGDHFASVGSDSKIFLYDGKTGETIAELTDSSHKGTIVSRDGSMIRVGRLIRILLDVLLLEPR
jgi:WD40 repeat protein